MTTYQVMGTIIKATASLVGIILITRLAFFLVRAATPAYSYRWGPLAKWQCGPGPFDRS
jgi:hypothetical protein